MWHILLVTGTLVFFSLSTANELQNDGDNLYNQLPTVKTENMQVIKLDMTVFYEALCPDSVSFFEEQFSKNWLPFYNYLNISLVPYGKASQTRDEEGNWKFSCQHGEKECYLNRIQACAISRMIPDSREKLFSFISCYMSLEDKREYDIECAGLVDIKFSQLEECAKNKEGFDLLASFGDVTHNFSPKIKWIPTIVFNDKYNETENYSANSDLRTLLCEKLNNQPEVCR